MGGGGECWSGGGKPVPDVAEISGVGRLGEELVDDRPDVVESRDWCERRSSAGAEGPSRDGEEERGTYDLDGDAAIVKLAGELPVGASQVAGCSGSEAIQIEDALDVEPTWDGRHGLTIGSAVLGLGRGCA